jgi:hypothetical protein
MNDRDQVDGKISLLYQEGLFGRASYLDSWKLLGRGVELEERQRRRGRSTTNGPFGRLVRWLPVRSCPRDLLQHVADCNHILLHYDAPPDLPHHFFKNPYSI